ncbi:protein-glutamine glutaminase family protein [Streptomyces sp. 4N124]|uniref:protein-glutamine glutaminase family protein n=1 Tax=Streptomyces sp. 4N124 TaxID=3457420 RepID=UPI003FD448AA
MRRSARDETYPQGTGRAPRRAPDRAEDSTAHAGSPQPAHPLLALQRSAGNAAVTAVIQRMEAPGGKRRRSRSPEDQQPAKHAREAETESSSEEEDWEWEEQFAAASVEQISEAQTKTAVLLEQMDNAGASDRVKSIAQDKLDILSLLKNLAPLRSVETVREAIRLVSEKPDSTTKTRYLEKLEDQLEYLAQDFPSAGPPTKETLEAMWPQLVPAFGSAGGQVGQDGCEDRAHAICLAIAKRDPAIAVNHLSKQWATSSGGRVHADHQWKHHVAASVTTADGVLVIDPIFSTSGPLELSDWANRVQVNKETNVHQTAWGFLGKPGDDNRPDAASAMEYSPQA